MKIWSCGSPDSTDLLSGDRYRVKYLAHIYRKRCVYKLFELLEKAKALMLRLHLSKSRKTETSLEMIYGEIKACSFASPKYQHNV